MTPVAVPCRRGVALVWALIILSLLTVVMGLVTWEGINALKLADRRQQQLQAVWLARSGVELAAARLLGDTKEYQGETVELIPGGRVHITVQTSAARPGEFQITSEARYPADETNVVVRQATRTVRRIREKDQTRLEVVSESKEPGKPKAP